MLAADRLPPIRLRFELPEVALPECLPADAQALRGLLVEQQRRAIAQIEAQAIEQIRAQMLEHIRHLYEQIALMRRRQFGPSSESMPGQARLFDEAGAGAPVRRSRGACNRGARGRSGRRRRDPAR